MNREIKKNLKSTDKIDINIIYDNYSRELLLTQPKDTRNPNEVDLIEMSYEQILELHKTIENIINKEYVIIP